MSKNLYVLSIGGFTALGIFTSFLVAQATTNWEIGLWHALGVLMLGIGGIVLSRRSDNPVLSFAGFMMVAVPYGALLGPLLNEGASPFIKEYFGVTMSVDIAVAFLVTTIYVAIFGLIGALIPDNLQGWGGWLLGGLIVALVGYFVIPIAGIFGLNVNQALDLWDWLIVALFAFIIMFDFNRAMKIPYTLDNSIDVAIAIYLDWFNVFVRIFRKK